MNFQKIQIIPIARRGAESLLATNKVIHNSHMRLLGFVNAGD